MRWLFLLLLVLNLFYYVWSQQQSPLRGIEVTPIEQYHAKKKDIRLLSESTVPEPNASFVGVASRDASTCMLFGGFEERNSAETFQRRLIGLDIQAEIQELDTQPALDYWVYLPPLGSREASLRQLKELQARQIDSYIIADGDLANGISLGIFTRPESAAGVVSRLVGAGYAPAMRELQRAQKSYWVRVGAAGARLIDDQVLSILALDFSGLKHEPSACSDTTPPSSAIE